MSVHLRPEEIEAESFRIIDAEAGAHAWSAAEWPVVRRVIHTSADFEYLRTMVISPGAVTAGIRALKAGRGIVTDTTMALAGISKPRLGKYASPLSCFVADAAVATEAAAEGVTRSIMAMRRGTASPHNGIFVIGNAPTALFELLRQIRDDGLRPDLIVGLPVGFVGAAESKEELLATATASNVPFITNRGRKGGSNVAAAVINALLILAAEGAAVLTRDNARGALRYGFTTGACAAAAAKGAALMLREQKLIDAVEINLPIGRAASFRLHGQQLTASAASCYVIKDAGDDPDITNGAEIHVSIKVDFFTPHRMILQGGKGIGRVTKPGLAVKVGEWAINPVPRSMILEGVKEVLAVRCIPATFTITVSIPNGEELARKTLNERLGIIGGLSILGTTGIVKPISTKAWTDTLDCALDVALASGSSMAVLSTGRTSELTAQKYLGSGERTLRGLKGPGTGNCLREEAFVMMGDHVGYALRACLRKGVPEVILAGQFAKLLKIACGHEQTHASSAELDLQALAAWSARDPRISHLEPLSRHANSARQVLEDSGNDTVLIALVCGKAAEAAKKIVPGLAVRVLLAGYQGEVLYFA